jgi:hypothetical protein
VAYRKVSVESTEISLNLPIEYAQSTDGQEKLVVTLLFPAVKQGLETEYEAESPRPFLNGTLETYWWF